MSTDAARRIKLTAIRARAQDHADTTTAALDRRWLLAEVWQLQRELDNATERLTALLADYERDTTP